MAEGTAEERAGAGAAAELDKDYIDTFAGGGSCLAAPAWRPRIVLPAIKMSFDPPHPLPPYTASLHPLQHPLPCRMPFTDSEIMP